jgi:flotillin
MDLYFPFPVAKQTLEGHQRAIISSMTVEEIYRDRKKFSARVFEVASTDLACMGFIVISYTIKDVRDDFGYLEVRQQQ